MVIKTYLINNKTFHSKILLSMPVYIFGERSGVRTHTGTCPILMNMKFTIDKGILYGKLTNNKHLLIPQPQRVFDITNSLAQISAD